jgi:TetR/AcrR family transcriptional repressor of nem operon
LFEMGGTESDLARMIADTVLRSAVRLEQLLKVAVDRGELPEDTVVHGKALALQALMIGSNALSKAVRKEQDLWLTTRTTLEGLGLYDDESDAGLR